ncbi:hypothetical protein EYF80_033564 [Liparis tanakae]|uniref:Uncharacterized protein n=1 Tax=Liparis tanakae TaxID=230148 RepID=A0A4Z2GR84_9TELE|nr:hypothetical protein EYF80_033564 [Liparis tanakae]
MADGVVPFAYRSFRREKMLSEASEPASGRRLWDGEPACVWLPIYERKKHKGIRRSARSIISSSVISENNSDMLPSQNVEKIGL